MVFLRFSYTFSSGLVAVILPPAGCWVLGAGCWFSYGFPVVFLHFQLWAGGCNTSTGGRRQRVPSSSFPMGFLWFSYIFSTEPVAIVPPPGTPPQPAARFHFPVVFLWFSYTFSPGPAL